MTPLAFLIAALCIAGGVIVLAVAAVILTSAAIGMYRMIRNAKPEEPHGHTHSGAIAVNLNDPRSDAELASFVLEQIRRGRDTA